MITVINIETSDITNTDNTVVTTFFAYYCRYYLSMISINN